MLVASEDVQNLKVVHPKKRLQSHWFFFFAGESHWIYMCIKKIQSKDCAWHKVVHPKMRLQSHSNDHTSCHWRRANSVVVQTAIYSNDHTWSHEPSAVLGFFGSCSPSAGPCSLFMVLGFFSPPRSTFPVFPSAMPSTSTSASASTARGVLQKSLTIWTDVSEAELKPTHGERISHVP